MHGKGKSLAVPSKLYRHTIWKGGCGEARVECAGTLCVICDAAIPQLATEGNKKPIELGKPCQPTEMLQQHSLDLDWNPLSSVRTRIRTMLESKDEIGYDNYRIHRTVHVASN